MCVSHRRDLNFGIEEVGVRLTNFVDVEWGLEVESVYLAGSWV